MTDAKIIDAAILAALDTPRTVEELVSLLQCSERTVYRKLDALGGKVSRYGIGRPAQYVTTDRLISLAFADAHRGEPS